MQLVIKNNAPAKPKHERYIAAAAIVVCIAFIAVLLRPYAVAMLYPKKYGEYVEKYSREYGVDKNLVYAVIRTESGFDPNARSDVGARGLMQLMQDTFDWVEFRMAETDSGGTAKYDDMYDPEQNIKYGTYLLDLLLEEYEDAPTAVAAYHTGRGNVNSWLESKDYSEDGCTLTSTPSAATNHYIEKVMRAYEVYSNEA